MFKRCFIDLFEAYHTSAVKTVRWPMLYFFIYNLSRIDDVSYIMADLFEIAHEQLETT